MFKIERISDIFIRIGTFIILQLFLIISITMVLFLFKGSINSLIFPTSVLLSIVLVILSFEDKRASIISILFGVAITIIVVYISYNIYDWSWDGNAYHKEIVGRLENGWNPIYIDFDEYQIIFQEKHSNFSIISGAHFDSYVKASECIAASFYAFTGRIESGKAYNILSSIMALLICCSLIRDIKGMKIRYAFILSFFLVVNPIMLSQCFTFYNDNFLWQLFLICLISLLYIYTNPLGRYQRNAFLLVFISVAVGLNVKFSAIIFFGMLCGSFWLLHIYRDVKKGNPLTISKKLFFVLASACVVGFVFLGIHPYVTNIIRHNNPIYPMLSGGFSLNNQFLDEFSQYSNFKRFILSLFSKTDWAYVNLKIPFSVYESEIVPAAFFDVRIAGWGVLFSGIFLMSIFIIVYRMIRNRLEDNILLFYFVIINLVAIMFVPGLCWARFYGCLMYIPVGALVILYDNIQSFANKIIISRLLFGILVALLILNMLPNIRWNKSVLQASANTATELDKMKAMNDENRITVYTNSNHIGDLEGLYFNLVDVGISDFINGGIYNPDDKYEGQIFMNTVLFYK